MNLALIRLFIFLTTLLVISNSYAVEVLFKHNAHTLSGHYLEPTNGEPAKGILLFVHGDGATTYNAEGYYSILWEPLRKKGYAIFSWDKPGVGGSNGHWLDQSMAERQSEVLAAVDFVQSEYGFSHQKTGLMGFSQAGWVMPALAGKNSKVGFMIGIGFATKWIEQGKYHTKVRLQLEGKNQDQINLGLIENAKGNALLNRKLAHTEYEKISGDNSMKKQRYQFVLKNFMVDASSDYTKIEIPSLLVWGDKDKNVNAIKEFAWWQAHTNQHVKTKLIKNATHSMLDPALFDGQNLGLIHWIKLMWLEQEAFAVDFLPTVMTWLEELHP
jgi:alpha/beta superfamily hydrolase